MEVYTRVFALDMAATLAVPFTGDGRDAADVCFICVFHMLGIVYTNYRQSQVITGGRLLMENCELIDTMPDHSGRVVSASDIRRSNIVALAVRVGDAANLLI